MKFKLKPWENLIRPTTDSDAWHYCGFEFVKNIECSFSLTQALELKNKAGTDFVSAKDTMEG